MTDSKGRKEVENLERTIQTDRKCCIGVSFSESMMISGFFMPPPRSGEGHIVLPLPEVCTYIRTSVTRFSTVPVSATPLKVFDAET